MRIYFSHEKKTLVYIALVLVLLLLVTFGILIPTITNINKMTSDISALKLMLEKKYSIAKNMQRTRKEIEKIETISANYDFYFFHPGDELRLITELENIANKNRLTAKIDNPNWKIGSDHQLNVSISLTGEYHQILNYINELEKSHFFLNIRSIHLAPSISGASTSAALNLQLSIYANS